MSKVSILVGDFETTVYDGQTETEVWASALVPLNSEDVLILHSIEETFAYLLTIPGNIIVYYHNLKFDGSYWLSYIITKLKLKQAFYKTPEGQLAKEERKEMENDTFLYNISSMGQWYSITIKTGNRYIEFRDSLKLLPFSVKRIGESFKTKHQKLEMEYEGYRYAGCEITPEEKRYIANDVLVVKEALEIMFEQGHNSLTIGACCLKEFKRIINGRDPESWDNYFPNVYECDLDESIYGSPNAGKYILNSYRGGWCYVVPEKANTIYYEGLTADVNSLYPSVMHSQSGNRYPVGPPHFWKGDIPDWLKTDDSKYYFVRVKTRFYIKDGYLPFIQIKRNKMYKSTESLTTSDIYNPLTGKYYREYVDLEGNVKPAVVVLTLTCTDWKLIQEHYRLEDTEILDGCWFFSEIGLFDEYIDKYKKIKMTSKGALRELAKLFLNNLYGKLATSTVSSFKYALADENDVLGYDVVVEDNKKPVYIPCGSAITSYARNFTIRTAQKNYHGKNKPGFIYADTDSIHCDLKPDELIDVPVHDSEFCHWKLESYWDKAIFARQKTYIEHVTHEDGKPVEEPYNNIKCAGMPKRCKDLLNMSMTGKIKDEDKMNEQEKEFVHKKRTYEDFKKGLVVPSKLLPRTIKGGVILVNTTYEMR